MADTVVHKKGARTLFVDYVFYLQIYKLVVLLPFGLRLCIFSMYPAFTSSLMARLTVETLHLVSAAILLWEGKQLSFGPCL